MFHAESDRRPAAEIDRRTPDDSDRNPRAVSDRRRQADTTRRTAVSQGTRQQQATPDAVPSGSSEVAATRMTERKRAMIMHCCSGSSCMVREAA